jgi:hypothetical protein
VGSRCSEADGRLEEGLAGAQKDKLSEVEEEEEEYIELLKMKGYGSSRIKALLKKRRAKASSRETEDKDNMPLADMLARSDGTGYVFRPIA